MLAKTHGASASVDSDLTLDAHPCSPLHSPINQETAIAHTCAQWLLLMGQGNVNAQLGNKVEFGNIRRFVNANVNIYY